jgi:hypothetical protein
LKRAGRLWPEGAIHGLAAVVEKASVTQEVSKTGHHPSVPIHPPRLQVHVQVIKVDPLVQVLDE